MTTREARKLKGHHPQGIFRGKGELLQIHKALVKSVVKNGVALKPALLGHSGKKVIRIGKLRKIMKLEHAFSGEEDW